MKILVFLLLMPAAISLAQVTSTDGNTIYTELHGEGDTTLLFIHGWNLDHTFWENQVNEFSAEYTTVIMDLPGNGRSGNMRTNWSMNAYGLDVLQVIDQLGLNNVILVAHSMGGSIALEAIDQDNSSIIGLVGIDNFKQVGAISTAEDEQQIAAFIEMLREDYPTNVRITSEGFMFAPDSPSEPKERVLSQYASVDPAIAIAVLEGVFEADDDEAQLVETLEIPFSVISANYIPLEIDGINAHYSGPGFHLYTLDGSGHFPMVERPETFNALLKQALKEMF